MSVNSEKLYEQMKKEHAGIFILIPESEKSCVLPSGEMKRVTMVDIVSGGCGDCLAYNLAVHAFDKPEFKEILMAAVRMLPTITAADVNKVFHKDN